MSQKEDRLMSIGEIAKSLGITRRIILNYEEKNLLQADVKDGATGNRYYLARSAYCKTSVCLWMTSRHITTELLIWSL